ncbi:MAG TPA: TetR/AcrR family transcriptional regulator [Roseiarcus sp.]
MSSKLVRISRPNSEGRREQILAAALKVMIAEGVYHATTRKIAEAAGVNVATLHYHFQNKEEILFCVLEGLASSYRAVLAKRFAEPQTLKDRIHDLLHFIFHEIEQARSEQLVHQEMTLYVLRYPHAQHMAAAKDREIFKLYEEMLLASSDVRPEQATIVHDIANFLYTAFVGILHQWLATGDRNCLLRTTNDLIEAARTMADDRLTKRSLPSRARAG